MRRIVLALAVVGLPLIALPAPAPERPATRLAAAVPTHAQPPVPGEVIRLFDPPADPYGPGHRGVDLRASPGERVRSALPGTVTFAGPVAGRGWVTVAHGGGLDTTYGWLEPRSVTAGQAVRTGQVLGRLAADATHLDWGARLEGSYIDPLLLLGRWEALLVRADPAA